jgi:hypothetical protein
MNPTSNDGLRSSTFINTARGNPDGDEGGEVQHRVRRDVSGQPASTETRAEKIEE